MNAQATTVSQSQSKAGLGVALFAALIGLAVISLTGHVQASALHDAAHDVRHATGFPCH
ncbi:MAG: CbtB domain-containing protein [Paracoccaceae bacterium]|jgi:cobalt transporter subunit CbtB